MRPFSYHSRGRRVASECKSALTQVELWACFARFVALTNSNSVEAISFSVWLAASISLLLSQLNA